MHLTYLCHNTMNKIPTCTGFVNVISCNSQHFYATIKIYFYQELLIPSGPFHEIEYHALHGYIPTHVWAHGWYHSYGFQHTQSAQFIYFLILEYLIYLFVHFDQQYSILLNHLLIFFWGGEEELRVSNSE